MKAKLKIKNIGFYRVMFFIFFFSYLLVLTDIPFISMHITNFAITGGLATVNIYRALDKGQLSYGLFASTLIFLAGINIVVEFFVRAGEINLFFITFIDFNTPDPIDALFGIIALVIVGFTVIKYFSTVTFENELNNE